MSRGTVRRIVRSGETVLTYERREQMMSHYLVKPPPCTPGAAWEKGQVESQVKNLRQELFVPRPRFKSLQGSISTKPQGISACPRRRCGPRTASTIPTFSAMPRARSAANGNERERRAGCGQKYLNGTRTNRDQAQLESIDSQRNLRRRLSSGARGREFESARSDHLSSPPRRAAPMKCP